MTEEELMQYVEEQMKKYHPTAEQTKKQVDKTVNRLRDDLAP